MPIEIKYRAAEQASIVLYGTLTDEAGSDMLPIDLVWSLRDRDKQIINSRDQVVLADNSEFTIVLSGPDLPFRPGGYLTVTVECTYDGVDQDDLSFKGEVRVLIENLEGVS